MFPRYSAHDRLGSLLDTTHILAVCKGEEKGWYWIRVYFDCRQDSYTLRYDHDDDAGRINWQYDYDYLAHEGKLTNDAYSD